MRFDALWCALVRFYSSAFIKSQGPAIFHAHSSTVVCIAWSTQHSGLCDAVLTGMKGANSRACESSTRIDRKPTRSLLTTAIQPQPKEIP